MDVDDLIKSAQKQSAGGGYVDVSTLLKVFLKRFPALSSVVAFYFAYRDSVTPQRVKISVILGFCYVLFPLDLVPDFLPLLGWGDDALVVWACVRMLRPYVRSQHRKQASDWLKRMSRSRRKSE